MADNIKIVGNIINTSTVSRYSTEDTNLISSKNIQDNFGGEGDYIEFYVYDVGGNLLNTNYNYLNYKLPPTTGLTPGVSTPPNTTGEIQTDNVGVVSTLSTPTSSLYPIIEIDPVKDLQDLGYSSGEFNTRYNFFYNRISNFNNSALFIKEISQDRTEIRLASTTLTNDEIESSVNLMIEEINSSDYYVDYLLNFGTNEQYVAVNIALNKAPEGYEVLFKLYKPLPLTIQEKRTLWVVEEKVSPYVFDINLDKLITPAPGPKLRGPNFDIEIPNQGTVSTAYNTYSNLVTNLQSLQQNSYHQILNLLATQSADINIDYTDYNNFIFFGSAYQRLSNFYTKVKEIEDYNNFITTYTPFVSTTASLQITINQYSSSISDIISKFDGYESYMYFESGTYAWPKSGSLKPYSLLSTGSTTTITWYNNLTGSAKSYDLDNYNNLEYAVPIYLRDDENNQPFLLFLNMVGHYFDNIWIYLRSITDINLANNNLEAGISKDLVYDRLKSLGVHLYNSQAGDNVDQYLVGANTGSSIFDNNYSLTGSYLNNVPRKDIVAELYKRIYHNLPLLLKQKGTVSGLENLITTFGIPSKPYESANGGPCALYEVYVSDTSIDSELDLIYCGEILPRNWVLPSTITTPTFTDYIWVDTSYPITINSGPITLTLVDTGDTTILNVKEFGGSLKADLLKGYNNDKVRIVDNSIVSNTIYSGSVLSPFHSLQTYPTASSQFRENDMHYVDISFSPQTQIDTYISGAIASNNPTWSLDDYIGDPRQQYLTTYPDLDTQRKLYFETGVSGYAPFTASALDYNGFIRLIQYFDNSLFKMLADFVPERASLSTGITINSPVLERNKVSYANPTSTTTQSVYDANYEISTISSQYGTFYNALSSSNNTMGWYDGEISGSTVDVHQYFIDNYNPYLLGNTSSYNAWHPADQQINTNTFLHSDWNVLLNNVSKSVVSQFRQRIEYFWGTTSSILLPAELQDSYLSLRSYNTSRYEGSKLTSKYYNNYTSASYTGSDGITIQNGDKSYGKTAVIDHYVRKIGLFTSLKSELFLTNKTDGILKYLIDENGNLTELNKKNKHWEEVQNTFKAGTYSAISLFDNQKFSNQKRSDGEKLTFNSGYSYTPLFYFSSTDTTASFQYEGESQTNMFKYETNGGTLGVGGTFTYQIANNLDAAIENIFGSPDNPIYNDNNIYTPGYINVGGLGCFGYYDVAETKPYGFEINNLKITHTSTLGIGAGQCPTYSFFMSSSYGTEYFFTSSYFPKEVANLNGIIDARQYPSGSKIYFGIGREIGSLSNITQSINAGGIFQSTLSGGTPYALAPFTSSINSTQFCLDEQFAVFYGYLFLPQGYGVYPSSSLYSTYGPVDYNFTISPGDYIKFILYDISYEFEIASVDITPGLAGTGSLCININGIIPNSLVGSGQNISQILILKKLQDETSIIFSYIKPIGQTSYGFIIPDNLTPEVLENIDTITSQVKTKLVNDQGSIITDINGGGF